MVAHGLRRMRSLNPEYTLKVWDDGEMEEYIKLKSSRACARVGQEEQHIYMYMYSYAPLLGHCVAAAQS